MAIQARGRNAQEVLVKIKVDRQGQISVLPKQFKLHKHRDQYVRWICNSREPFMVEFENGSPFYEAQFSTDHPCSGFARREVLPAKFRPYKYTVRVGDKLLDPQGQIEK